MPAPEKAKCAACEGRRFACYLGDKCIMYERKPCPDCAGGMAENKK